MIFRALFAACIAVFTVVAAGAQDNPILNRMAALTQAYNARDASAVAGFYTDQAALLPPRSRALVGREAIAGHYAQAFSQGVGDLAYRVIEIDHSSPETAVEIGETTVKFGEKTISGRSIHVWKQVNGSWYLHRDMYHVLGVSQ